jgi:hypothetical protein
MANIQFNEFNLPIDAYAAFDALSLKNLIIARLNANNIFTDQNYEGSNLSSIIDIIAYSYHVLLFYLNRTGAESTFTTAELYENINKIVKLVGYSPIGYQTAILSFQAAANASLPPNTYTIPRYSYFTVNGTFYSFNKDITFLKTTNSYEVLTDLYEQNLLYQGIYTEYPTYVAAGEPFELVTLTVIDLEGQNTAVDHFNIDVYVRDNTLQTPKWEKWEPVQSLFLERPNATVYEVRLNENLRYEFKFGNNINGKQLNPGDEVAIYYLKSAKSQGEIGPGVLNGNRLFKFTTPRFSAIQADVTPANISLMSEDQHKQLIFTNSDPSTKFVEVESADSIKVNALNTFRSQFRLITTSDFENFLSRNYSNLLGSVRVINNWDYLSGHLKYFFDLGVSRPNTESRILYSQVKFADASNSNNIYIYAVPKLEKTNSLTTRINYLNNAQKQLIINDIQPIKLTTSEIVINDPIYMAVDIGVKSPTEELTTDISGTTVLELTRNVTAKRNPESLKAEVTRIFQEYFSTTRDNLGLFLSISDLSNAIISIPGVDDVRTKRVLSDGTIVTVPGISLLVFNPVYPFDDIQIITQDTQLPYFKFPYLNNADTFLNKIEVVTPSIQLLDREF